MMLGDIIENTSLGRFNIPYNVTSFFAHKRRLISLSREQYHIDFNNRQWYQPEVRELAGYVKYYVLQKLQQQQHPSTDMETLRSNLLTKLHRYCNNNNNDDDDDDEPLNPNCSCIITDILLVLIQIFSYDVCLLRYFMDVLTRACRLRGDKCVHVFLGNSNSGKTFLLELVIGVLGSAAGLLSGTTARQGLQERTHDLSKGRQHTRVWYMDETTGLHKLNTNFIKQITGRSDVWLRGNYESGNTEKLEPTLFMFGNSPLLFDQYCPAMISRLRIAFFRSRFEKQGKMPIFFRRCQFPQFPLMTDLRRKRALTAGMAALFLHITCQAPSISSSSAFNDNDFLLPTSIQEATIIFSPEIELVRRILQKLGLKEDNYSCITSKRLNDLVKDFSDDLRKFLHVTPQDAVMFVEQQYMTSLIAVKNLAVPYDHVNEGEINTWIIHGLKEEDVNNKGRGKNNNLLFTPQQ